MVALCFSIVLFCTFMHLHLIYNFFIWFQIMSTSFFVLPYNKSLNDWSPMKQFLLFNGVILFVTVCLRVQSNPANYSDFKGISPERAFADFIFASIILHLVVMNFIGWGSFYSNCKQPSLWTEKLNRNKIEPFLLLHLVVSCQNVMNLSPHLY